MPSSTSEVEGNVSSDARSKAAQPSLYVAWSGTESIEISHQVAGAKYTDSDSRENRNEYAHRRACDIDVPFISSRNVSNEPNSLSNASLPRIPDPVVKAERELKKFLQLRHEKSDVAIDFAAKQQLILCDDSGFKLSEMTEQLRERLKGNRMADLINPKCFHQVS